MKLLEDMAPLERAAYIMSRCPEVISDLRGHGITLQDFYSPCEEWIPMLVIDLRKLVDLVVRIDAELAVPAAEYVPAIQAVFELIDKSGLTKGVKL